MVLGDIKEVCVYVRLQATAGGGVFVSNLGLCFSRRGPCGGFTGGRALVAPRVRGGRGEAAGPLVCVVCPDGDVAVRGWTLEGYATRLPFVTRSPKAAPSSCFNKSVVRDDEWPPCDQHSMVVIWFGAS